MARSLLSLPVELRLQIYRCLLCHSSRIQLQRPYCVVYWSEIQRAKRPLSGSEPEVDERFLPESAILRVCRQIYSEAMPVLYGENAFVYWCPSIGVLDYPQTRFPYVNLKYMNHLELEVELHLCFEQMAALSVATTIKYFIEHGCDLQTFQLSLNELWVRHEDDDGTYEHQLLRMFAASQELMAALVALNVSKTLTISVWYRETSDHELQMALNHEDCVSRLASEKEMRATKEESKFAFQDTSEDEVDNDPGEEEAEEEEEEEEKDQNEPIPTAYRLSWCLRPQYSEQQSAKVATQAIQETGGTF